MADKIAVIGAGGKMGKWVCNYLSKKKYDVVGYDNENSPPKTVTLGKSLISSILNVDYVILCTPTKKTPEIIRLIGKEMKRGAKLVDISSQKSKTSTSLGKVPNKITPVCIHPMFGPGVKNIKNRNIISIPIKDGKKELDIAKSLFPEANFVTIDSKEHDKKIALILGLPHLVNLVFANVLSKDEKIMLTEKMSGTTFKVQKILAESILTESPELIETIISNPDIRLVAEGFWKDFGNMLTYAQEGKTEEIVKYVNTCTENLSKNTNISNSYKKLTAISKLINK